MTTHYHAGYNMPGCHPEMTPYTLDSFATAKDFILCDLEAHLDDDYVANNGKLGRDRETGQFVPFIRAVAIKNLRDSPPGDWDYNTGDLAYWITQCDEVGPDHEGDE